MGGGDVTWEEVAWEEVASGGGVGAARWVARDIIRKQGTGR